MSGDILSEKLCPGDVMSPGHYVRDGVQPRGVLCLFTNMVEVISLLFHEHFC